MEKFEISKSLENFKERLNAVAKVINISKTQDIISSNENKMADSTFWEEPKEAARILQANTELKDTLSTYQELLSQNEELEVILELDDEELLLTADQLIDSLEKALTQFETALLLNEEFDAMNAIIELHPGAGGTEAQDWALMLFRMYRRFCERRQFTFELVDYLEGTEAGLKSVTFSVKGKYAYGTLKGEKGVHRLVRISPFDSGARRHTSFVACNVIPEFDNNIEVEINSEDIRIDTYRSSGAGGQHVNTTDSAVRITHIPTSIVVSCQNERSQIQNRERAMQILKAKIYQKTLEEQNAKIRNIGGELTDNAFGSQIRSYVLHPYAMVKDHRTLTESSNPDNVLDGDLEIFINSFLRYQKK